MYFNLAYRGDRRGYGPHPRVWIIERVVDTPAGPRLEVWGHEVAPDGWTETWWNESEYGDLLRQSSDDAYWVPTLLRYESVERPEAVALSGDPRAEAVPSTPHGKPHEFPL
jgi:hypothetical protein